MGVSHSQAAQKLSNVLSKWLQRASPSETQILIVIGLLVGVGAGVGAVLFRYLIDGFQHFFFDILEPALASYLGSGAIILIPAIGGLIFGPMIYFFAREAKGHGVPEVMLAVSAQGARIRPIVAVIKSLASAVCIGSGGSVGREGPIVQIGSALGSSVGQVLRVSADRSRTLIACGAAGGIAATFNAPIAGVFFALEVILGEFTTRAFGVVVLASVAASVVGQSVFGNQPAFPVPSYELVHPGELGLYAILAVLAALIGIGFTKTLYWFEDRFDDVPMIEFLKPVPGGLMLGGIGFFIPEIFGVGYEAIENALGAQYDLQFLLFLVAVKVIAVSITIGSGGSGGVFAPALFIGAMLGSAFGQAAGSLFPGAIAPPGAYGLVGMAAVFSGSARAPITAVIILFELTGDYRIILPLMGAVVISTFVSESLSKDTIYTLKLRRRGVDISQGRNVDLMRSIRVSNAMSTEVPTAAHDLTVTEAADRLQESGGRALVVVDDAGELDGIVTLEDIERVFLENRPGATLSDVASRPVLTEFPDGSLSQAMQRMGVRDLGQLPVVERGNPTRVVGLLRRADIVRAYNRAMLERIESQRGQPLPLNELRGIHFVEVTVQPSGPLVSYLLKDLKLPAEALVVAIERDGTILVPHGKTQLQGGDRLQILVRDDKVAQLHEHLASLRNGSASISRAEPLDEESVPPDNRR